MRGRSASKFAERRQKSAKGEMLRAAVGGWVGGLSTKMEGMYRRSGNGQEKKRKRSRGKSVSCRTSRGSMQIFSQYSAALLCQFEAGAAQSRRQRLSRASKRCALLLKDSAHSASAGV